MCVDGYYDDLSLDSEQKYSKELAIVLTLNETFLSKQG